MFIIGITGSIGSGKSTVSRILADTAKIPVVDADKIAREIVEPGREALIHIIDAFGDDMIRKNGTLNRRKLGDLVFSNVVARAKLNSIMFPIIRERVIHLFNDLARAGNKYAIYDAPLLYESGMENLVDYTVLVYVPRDTQIERISLRNNLTWAQATARVEAQPSGEELLEKQTDYLITNTHDYNVLNGNINSMWKSIQENAADTGKGLH